MRTYIKKGTGLRTWKTALAVAICALVFGGLNNLGTFEFEINPAMACIAAVLTMQDSIQTSKNYGKGRIIGTIIGCAMALLFIPLAGISDTGIYYFFLYGGSIFILIWFLNLVKLEWAVAAACIGFVLTFNFTDYPIAYGLLRSFETLFGVCIALLINIYINPKGTKLHNLTNNEDA